MKCHFVYDEKAGKVLIPGCYGSLHRNDKAMCTCHIPDAGTQTYKEFERLSFNLKVQELKTEIKDLHSVVKRLESDMIKQHRIIEKLKSKLS